MKKIYLVVVLCMQLLCLQAQDPFALEIPLDLQQIKSDTANIQTVTSDYPMRLGHLSFENMKKYAILTDRFMLIIVNISSAIPFRGNYLRGACHVSFRKYVDNRCSIFFEEDFYDLVKVFKLKILLILLPLNNDFEECLFPMYIVLNLRISEHGYREMFQNESKVLLALSYQPGFYEITHHIKERKEEQKDIIELAPKNWNKHQKKNVNKIFSNVNNPQKRKKH